MPSDRPCLARSGTALRRAALLLRPHASFVLTVLVALFVARLAWMLWLSHRIQSPDDVVRILLGGLRMDVSILCYIVAPALLLSLAFGDQGRLGKVTGACVRAYLTAWAVVFTLFEVITPSFVEEFDSRPGRLFIEYAVHPREVGSMILKGYPLQLVLATLLVGAMSVVAWRGFGRLAARPSGAGPLARLVMLLLVAPAILGGARASLSHRPANPSSVAFSDDHLLNELCLSSTYSVAFALYRMKDEADAAAVYGTLESDEAVFAEVRAAMTTVPSAAFTSTELPTLHHQEATARPTRARNVVILLEESLGASYVGALGGEPVTQFLDTLRDEGWWFEHMYATGTRSVRGIEAVTTGFPPTPARSVVKLGLAQHGFFTLAEYLGRKGYETQFIYGGESHFDNMKGFLTGNGFETVVDETDFDDPTFRGSWGVSDEDIFSKAHETFLAAGDRPFFSLVFSVSNHSPWEYPTDRIVPYDSPAATPGNAVRYADFALGRFFELARSAPYWENTVFLVVSDHCSRVFGASLVPIEHFHIPAVILGPGVPSRRDSRVTSQLDLAPTLLSLIGVSGEHPMIGHDLTRLPADAQGRAIMQYGSNQAYLEGDDVVVLQPELPPTQFRLQGGRLVPGALEPSRVRRALAHALLPTLLYSRQLYRLPEPSGLPLPEPELRTARALNEGERGGVERAATTEGAKPD